MDLIGQRIESYLVTDLVGQGGMGAVWKAWDETLRREVALKSMLGTFSESDEGKARFLQEARTLSRLRHPGICQIHDWIENEVGSFLVLELLRGTTLSAQIDTTKPLEQRLRIALEIVDALAAAHREGIVHRDLKPGNVMIDEDLHPHVLDFGLARRTADAATELLPRVPSDAEAGKLGRGSEPSATGPRASPLATAADTVLGTPGYMSPEQAHGEPATPASDMYSFGVMLHELVGGKPLFTPTMRVEDLLYVSAHAAIPALTTGPKGLIRLVADLTEAEPSKRPSAEETKRRLQYELDRPARRLRWAGAAILTAALLLGSVKYTVDLRRERAQAVAARQATEDALDLVSGVLDASKPGSTASGQEVLDEARRRVDQSPLDPASRARIFRSLGDLYRTLGHLESAEEVLRDATSTHLEVLGAEDFETALSQSRLAKVLAGRGEFDEAERLYRASLETFEDAGSRGVSALAETSKDLALLLANHKEELEEAEVLFLRSLEIFESTLGERSPRAATVLQDLATLYSKKGDHERANELFERCLTLREEVLGPEHFLVGRLLNNFAIHLLDLGEHARAEETLVRSLAILEREIGRNHRDVGVTVFNLGTAERALERPVEALVRFERALAIFQKHLDPGHPFLVQTRLRIAACRVDSGELAEAVEALRAALDSGWDGATLATEADLAPLRGLPEFEQLVARAQGSTSEALREP